MNRKEFLRRTIFMSALPIVSNVKSLLPKAKEDYVYLLRHATLVVQFNNLKFLVDPMFSAKDAMDPVQNAVNTTRIPMVDLPITQPELDNLLKSIDGVIVTHTHRDHWDGAAQEKLDKKMTIFCQPEDLAKINEQGFQNVIAIEKSLDWRGVTLHRTGGQHGTGEIGKKMGPVSGFILQKKNKSIYIAGDTIWCDEVKSALNQFKPEVTVLNAGGARFTTGDPITMSPTDVTQVCEALPSTKIIAVHMDTINHCLITRSDLKEVLQSKNLLKRVAIPGDGETLLV